MGQQLKLKLKIKKKKKDDDEKEKRILFICKFFDNDLTNYIQNLMIIAGYHTSDCMNMNCNKYIDFFSFFCFLLSEIFFKFIHCSSSSSNSSNNNDNNDITTDDDDDDDSEDCNKKQKK